MMKNKKANLMKNKKAIVGLLSGCFILGLCYGCGNVQSTNTATEKAADATSKYESVLKNPDTTFNYDGEEYTAGQFAYYAYADINQDGTDEMILSTTADSYLAGDESALVLANVDGEVTPIFHVYSDAGAELRLDEEDAALTYYNRCSGEEHAEVYQFNDNELSQYKTLDHWQPYHHSDTGEDDYQIDGKDTSKETFEEEWATCYENATEVAYTSIN